MAITRSLEEKQTPQFILGPRSVRLLQSLTKEDRGKNAVHSTIVSKIKTRLLESVTDSVIKTILSDWYVLPLRPARHDVETNLQKIAYEVTAAIAEPSLVRSVHFMPSVMGDHAKKMTSFLNKEIGRFVQTKSRTSSSGDVIFDFQATAMIARES